MLCLENKGCSTLAELLEKFVTGGEPCAGQVGLFKQLLVSRPERNRRRRGASDRPEDGSHSGTELFHVERLGYVIVGAGVEPALLVIDGRMPGEHDDARLVAALTQSLEDLKTG